MNEDKQRSKKRKTYKDRNYDRKSKYNNNRKNDLPYMVVIKSPTAYRPDIFVTKHKFSTSFSLASTSGVVANQIIAGNDLYAPIVNTNQPVGYDQLAAWYANYMVTGCSIDVQVCPRGVVGADIVVAPYWSISGAAPNTMTCDQLSSQPFSKRSVSFLYDKIKLRQYVSTAKLTGSTQEQQLVTYAGQSGASPTNVWNWIISYQPSDRATTSTVDVVVNMVYYTRWKSPATIVNT